MTCQNCDTFDVELAIASPGELGRILAKLKSAVSAKELVYSRLESSRAFVRQPSFEAVEPDGPYPDVMRYWFDCPACGSTFELSVETYHGSGGHWRRLPEGTNSNS